MRNFLHCVDYILVATTMALVTRAVKVPSLLHERAPNEHETRDDGGVDDRNPAQRILLHASAAKCQTFAATSALQLHIVKRVSFTQ